MGRSFALFQFERVDGGLRRSGRRQGREGAMFAGFTAFTWFHTILSLIMLVAGIVVIFGMISGRRRDGWTALYFVTAVLTSVTGFGFLPIDKLLPSHIVAIISLVLLAIAILARYALHLAGVWRWIFAVTVGITVYLDYFVLVVQLFLKVPGLHVLAPTQMEPPFAIAQGLVLLVFAALTILAAIKFRPHAG
jgi:hypothetical protein